MKAFLFITIVMFTMSAYAEWNQWRGPNRDGRTTEFTAPKTFPDEMKKIWNVPVGVGHSSPVLSANRVFLISRIGDQETVAAYDLNSGKELWKDAYKTPYEMNPAAIPHGKGPKSTPIVANGKLYTFGITGILSCYDAASGKLIWRNDFESDFPSTHPDFGTAMSPAIDGNLLIVHAGGINKGALVALDATSGKQKWAWSGDGPAYASPIIVNFAGTKQVVTQSQKHIIGVSASGELLWQIPFTTEYEQNIVTPVIYKDLLIFSGIGKGVFAVRVSNKAGKWTPETVWENEKAAMYMNSPVVVGDHIYGMTHYRKGQFFCLDARTGETVWTSTGAEGDHAAFINTGNLLLILDDDAELTIANASPKSYEVIKKYTIANSPTWAHPAIQGNKIVIKDKESLAVWSFE